MFPRAPQWENRKSAAPIHTWRRRTLPKVCERPDDGGSPDSGESRDRADGDRIIAVRSASSALARPRRADRARGREPVLRGGGAWRSRPGSQRMWARATGRSRPSCWSERARSTSASEARARSAIPATSPWTRRGPMTSATAAWGAGSTSSAKPKGRSGRSPRATAADGIWTGSRISPTDGGA